MVTCIELTGAGKIITTCHFAYTEVFLLVSIIYLVLASVVTKLLNKLEAKQVSVILWCFRACCSTLYL